MVSIDRDIQRSYTLRNLKHSISILRILSHNILARGSRHGLTTPRTVQHTVSSHRRWPATESNICHWGPGFRTVLFKLFLFNVGDGSEGGVGTAVVVLIILLLLSPTVALAVCWTWWVPCAKLNTPCDQVRASCATLYVSSVTICYIFNFNMIASFFNMKTWLFWDAFGHLAQPQPLNLLLATLKLHWL